MSDPTICVLAHDRVMRAMFQAAAIATLVAAGGAFFAAPAGATTLTAVFTGTFDYIGNSLQEGDQNIPFTATVVYDPSLGSEIETTPNRETVSGDMGSGYVSPILSATFTAPGLNLVIPGDLSGAIIVGHDSGNYIELRWSYYGDAGQGYDATHGFDLDFYSPNLTMDPSQLFVSSPGDGGGGGNLESEPFYSDPQLSAYSLTITGQAAPEPASILILGAGLAGFGAWRRRHPPRCRQAGFW